MLAVMTIGTPALSHDLPVKAYPSNALYGMVVEHLKPLMRCIDLVQPDGNCMFRAISKELLGSERHHLQIRRLTTEFMAKNPKHFAPIVAKYHGHTQSLTEHIFRMKIDHVWGTAVELQAIASLYQVPIHILTYNTKAPNYRWNSYVPEQHKEVFEPPLYPTMADGTPPSEYHIELYYHDNCHFDRIAAQIPGKTSISLPNPLSDDLALLSNSRDSSILL